MGVRDRGVAVVTAPTLLVVAQMPVADPPPMPMFDIVFWVGVLAVLTLAIFGIGTLLRKKILADAERPVSATPFTLADLRRLHANGQLTDEEFERAKARIIAQSTRVFDADRRGKVGNGDAKRTRRPPLDVETIDLPPADDMGDGHTGGDIRDGHDALGDDIVNDDSLSGEVDGEDDPTLDDDDSDNDPDRDEPRKG